MLAIFNAVSGGHVSVGSPWAPSLKIPAALNGTVFPVSAPSARRSNTGNEQSISDIVVKAEPTLPHRPGTVADLFEAYVESLKAAGGRVILGWRA